MLILKVAAAVILTLAALLAFAIWIVQRAIPHQ